MKGYNFYIRFSCKKGGKMTDKIAFCPNCNRALAKSCEDIQKIAYKFFLVCKCGETIAEEDVNEATLNTILWRK